MTNCNSCDSTCISCNQAFEDKDAEIAALKSHLDETQQYLSVAHEDIATAEKEITELKAEVKLRVEQSNQAMRDFIDTKNSYLRVSDECAALKADVERWKRRTTRYSEKAILMDEENWRLREALEETLAFCTPEMEEFLRKKLRLGERK